ncbi:hypothetical protein QJS04_geneDACA020586 [Acorus gramineus]|uniref:Uncharacterized protein n=1 Tax=Acorus gramineus TaxID=55184 RepID=A0AAV9BTV8_ACOGR|nr:hypothetical protein QJS04_geneDACA020586 [Acorus gramineus]
MEDTCEDSIHLDDINDSCYVETSLPNELFVVAGQQNVYEMQLVFEDAEIAATKEATVKL